MYHQDTLKIFSHQYVDMFAVKLKFTADLEIPEVLIVCQYLPCTKNGTKSKLEIMPRLLVM